MSEYGQVRQALAEAVDSGNESAFLHKQKIPEVMLSETLSL